MNKSELRVRPAFILGLGLFFLLVCFLSETVFRPGNDRAKAMLIVTRSDERLIARSLCEHALVAGGLTNLNDEFVMASLTATNQAYFLLRTNASGEPVDVWQTPYRIGLLGPTDFIIRSAGKDKIFGNNDDIVYNSVSNDFAKP